jgi:FKBP-type peptidyl-prolyl cis-trans isomerase SlyD
MDKPQNKYITASYQLYSFDENGNRHLEEETQQGRPFQFISGFGMALDAFEKNIVDLEPGTKFDFELAAADGFGEYDPEGVHQMGRDVFTVNGQFDTENIFEGAVITMMDADERRFMARVVEITDNQVTIDTNHPLAGQKLQFTGTILENRDATNEEIQQMVNYLSGEGCGCGCDDCGDGCGKHEKGGCGCGHCHH